MAYPIRLLEPGRVFFVTNRCVQSRLLMRPSPEANRIIGAVLARATERFAVDLYAFSFASNHLHMLVRMRDDTCLASFVAQVEANIARRVGKLVGWRGRFWGRRYSAEPVLDNDALVGRLVYVLLHGVKENLVERAEQWPGLTCYPELAHGVVRTFDWRDDAGYNEAARRGDAPVPSKFVTRHTLKIAVLPCWEHLTAEQRQRTVRDLVRGGEEQARVGRGDKPVLGVAGVLAQDPLSTPEHSARSPRPLCHAASRELRDAFRAAYTAFLTAYRAASELWRKGVVEADFPLYCFRPPLPWALKLGDVSAVCAPAA